MLMEVKYDVEDLGLLMKGRCQNYVKSHVRCFSSDTQVLSDIRDDEIHNPSIKEKYP